MLALVSIIKCQYWQDGPSPLLRSVRGWVRSPVPVSSTGIRTSGLRATLGHQRALPSGVTAGNAHMQTGAGGEGIVDMPTFA